MSFLRVHSCLSNRLCPPGEGLGVRDYPYDLAGSAAGRDKPFASFAFFALLRFLSSSLSGTVYGRALQCNAKEREHAKADSSAVSRLPLDSRSLLECVLRRTSFSTNRIFHIAFNRIHLYNATGQPGLD
jgi:hypothetical protein